MDRSGYELNRFFSAESQRVNSSKADADCVTVIERVALAAT
jgi:hypothetical protein